MQLGIDFDNTLVCYDGVFHRVAMEKGLIPSDVPANKGSVRDYLREQGQENLWIEIQGYVYGPGMAHAEPFPGVLEFFQASREAGIQIRVISHKTKHPYAGPRYDLHAAAWGWLERLGFFDEAGIGLQKSRVHLELTKQDKLIRIGAAGCTHFIDDLPEFLAEPAFPTKVQRILFDPANGAGNSPFERAKSWAELADKFGVQLK